MFRNDKCAAAVSHTSGICGSDMTCARRRSGQRRLNRHGRRAAAPTHRLHRFARAHLAVDDARHGGEHWQRHAVLARQHDDGGCCGHALGNLRGRRQDRLQRLAAAEAHAHGAVARQVDKAGEHDVAHAGQAGQRHRLGAHALRKPPDLATPLRDQRSHGVVAQLQPLHDASCDGKHVLERAGHLDADDVSAGVDAQVAAGEQPLHAHRQLHILRRRHDGRRKALHELNGE
jgi:hypothetical protein